MDLPNFTFGIYQDLAPFDRGWQTFPGHYLLYASSGAFNLEAEDRQWLLPPHRAAWVAADVPIRLQSKVPVTSSSILFAKDLIPAPSFNCRVFAVSPLAREMILYAVRWGIDRDPSNPEADQFFTATANVCTQLAMHPDQFWLPNASSDELTTAINFIHDHIDTDLTTEKVAHAANISPRTLARRFDNEIHMTPRQFIRRARMLQAMQLLAENNIPIIQVAYSVGFNSVSAFTTTFRKFTDETPSQYQKRFQLH
jgi:AraC-like DNA-binding protein